MNYVSLAYNHKGAGNEFWKNKQYEKAKSEYSKALLAVNYIFKEESLESSSDTIHLVKDIQIPCLLNLAACHLSLKQNYEAVISHCSDVLKIEPGNIKALYRRATAYIELDKLELAKNDLINARELDPENESLREAQNNLRKKLKTSKKKMEIKQINFSIWTLIGKILFINCRRRFRIIT